MCPQAIIIAGQNGCGKSTLTKSQNWSVPLIDPDAFGPKEESPMQRRKTLLAELDRLESARESFALETTLSGKSLLKRIERLGENGYRITIF